MNELDALLKELNDPRSSYTPSVLMNNNMMGSPMFNNMRYQQEPTPDQSPMKSPVKSNMSMNQYQQMMSPSLRNPQSPGMKYQQNNNIPFTPQKSNLNKLNSPSLNGLNSPKIDDQKIGNNKSQSTPELSPQVSPTANPSQKNNTQLVKSKLEKLFVLLVKDKLKVKLFLVSVKHGIQNILFVKLDVKNY